MAEITALDWELKYEELELMYEEFKQSAQEFEQDLETELKLAQVQEEQLRKNMASLQVISLEKFRCFFPTSK